ncbi:uncharacterized protein LOC108665272 [Hyalella azteca]|uniref:Uncharacterized protein LOC108665272 n=1 Tax=Hyalella azteca TaxID=294128 RepID=A0A8B7N223_HYAAZ|nr:uncharacterized protein LOC108665272 [Hyalella azteca]
MMLREISLILLVFSVAVRCLPSLDGTTLCTINPPAGFYCGSCLQPYACDSSGVFQPLPECPSGTVCEGAAQCVPIASASVCKCVSDICDTHNPMYSAKCDADGIITDIEDCTGAQPDSGTCVGGSCVDCDGFAMSGPEYFVVQPNCSAGYQCDA